MELQACFFHSLATGLLLLQFFTCHGALTLHNFLLAVNESRTEERQHSSMCIRSCVTTALEKQHCFEITACNVEKNVTVQWCSGGTLLQLLITAFAFTFTNLIFYL